MNFSSLKINFLLLVFILIITYPLFYFSYKYYTPDLVGGDDYFQYYKMYKDWNFNGVDAPFNTRVISPFLVFIFNKLHIFYHTKVAFVHEGFDQHVYFSVIFLNFIYVVLTVFYIIKLVMLTIKNHFFAWVCGMLYLFGFGTSFYSLNAFSDSFSYLLFAVLLYYYLQKNLIALLFLLLAVFQREYILLCIGLIAAFHFFSDRANRKYYLSVFVGSIVCFGIYFILRKTIFYTPRYDHQMDVNNYFARLINPDFHWGDYFRQNFLSQNLIIFYFGILLYKYFKKIPFNRSNLLLVTLLLLQLVVITFSAYLGNNGGRYLYVIMPIIIYFIAIEVYPLLEKYFHFLMPVPAQVPKTETPEDV